MTQLAIVYARVSSARQVKEGHGLDSQDTRCKEYAKFKKYDVVKSFYDKGISGSVTARPGMQDMLKFLRQKKSERIVVIIDDISRLARGVKAHLELRNAIAEAGGKLESPSIEFGDDSDSVLVENLLASVSQHQRQKNAEQVKNRMRARLMNGYWTGKAPFGYRYKVVSRHGKLLVRDEPLATIVQNALEGYAHGRFETRPEILLFLGSYPEFPTGWNGRIHYQRVDDILNNPLYAGFVHFPNWNVNFVQGHHEGLISVETWQKVQARLKEQAKTTARVEVRDDFPLRGFVNCIECDKPLTACWTKGRTKNYAYYLCQTVDCSERKLSIPKDKLENEFQSLIESLMPSENLFKVAVKQLKDLWEREESAQRQSRLMAESELSATNKKIEQLMERIVAADSASVVKAYEEHIKNLELKKAELSEMTRNSKQDSKPFEELYRTGLEFLKNPIKLWVSGNSDEQRTFLKVAFSEPLKYCRKGGYRTAVTSCLIKLFGGFSTPNKVLVDPRGRISNHSATEELARICVIIEASQAISSTQQVTHH